MSQSSWLSTGEAKNSAKGLFPREWCRITLTHSLFQVCVQYMRMWVGEVYCSHRAEEALCFLLLPSLLHRLSLVVLSQASPPCKMCLGA